MSEHSELIAEARAEHQPMKIKAGITICGLDLKDWPCTYARLAEALEQQESESIATLLDMKDQRDIVVLDLAAAEREVVENRTMFERQAAAVRHHTARADAAARERDAARLGLRQIRELLDLKLPSEQTGPEWEQCARVPILFLRTIDDVLRGVLGEPATTNEPKPALHAAALAPTKEEPS